METEQGVPSLVKYSCDGLADEDPENRRKYPDEQRMRSVHSEQNHEVLGHFR